MSAHQHTVRITRRVLVVGLCSIALGSIRQNTIMAQGIAEADGPAPVTQIPEGYDLFEEDIVLPIGRATFGIALWPDGIVPFEFDNNVTSNGWQQNMLNAMAAWEAVASVDFVPRNGDSNFLHVQDATFNASEGIGMNGGRHDIWISNWSFGILAHELGHALAYWHEQSRSDRDAFIQIEWDNVSQTRCNGGSCDSQFEARGSGGEYGPYDFDSIMHYSACSFSCCADATPCESFSCASGVPDCRTITVRPPFDVDWQNNIGQRTHLSFLDALTMSFLYPSADWRFVDQAACDVCEVFSCVGNSFFCRYDSLHQTFACPACTFTGGYNLTPAGGTLWVQPGSYSAAGTYSRALRIEAPLGGVILIGQ